MADWSELPQELLEEIITHLKSSIDVSRLTSVCSTWRQSFPSQLNLNDRQTSINVPSNTFPLFFNGISICKRSIFVLSPPQMPIFDLSTNFNPWVIKVEKKSPNLYHLFFPLSWTQIPLSVYFPRSMDISNFRINDLGCEYFLRYTDKSSFKGDFVNLLKEQVAFLELSNGESFFLLTIHVSGKLALFDNVYNQWDFISDDFDLPYDDVIAFNREFYAVDCTGRTVLVKVDCVSNNNVDLVAKPVCGGDKKRLVEIGGELMLVDVYMGFPPFEEFGHKMDDLEDYVASKSMWFKVFRLDKEGKDWVEVKELGDYILFLGLYSSFSVSAADSLSLLKGNCIYFAFPDNFHPSCFNEDDDVFKFHSGGVYSLEDASISYSKLFWPPPPWFTSSS